MHPSVPGSGAVTGTSDETAVTLTSSNCVPLLSPGTYYPLNDSTVLVEFAVAV